MSDLEEDLGTRGGLGLPTNMCACVVPPSFWSQAFVQFILLLTRTRRHKIQGVHGYTKISPRPRGDKADRLGGGLDRKLQDAQESTTTLIREPLYIIGKLSLDSGGGGRGVAERIGGVAQHKGPAGELHSSS